VIRRKSYAKINLFLKVLGKRADGYHDIVTLMQRISLSDEMTFSEKGDQIVVKCPGSDLPEDEDNIIFRAAEALFSYTHFDGGVEITVTKGIPIAAGLGGGSSNAATTLITLNEMMGFNLEREELTEIGAKLGADVPFFILGKTAWASGIGDRLVAADTMPKIWYVLINPGFEVSTKEVYGNLKLGLTNGTIKYNMPRFKPVSQIIDDLANDLEEVSSRLYPSIPKMKEHLRVHGALGSLMSGSGPTVFGIFKSRNSALKAEKELRRVQGGSVFSAHSI
jgi:4-diphosphocytidyl-2-C-methyl-D-erythritol kinase